MTVSGNAGHIDDSSLHATVLHQQCECAIDQVGAFQVGRYGSVEDLLCTGPDPCEISNDPSAMDHPIRHMFIIALNPLRTRLWQCGEIRCCNAAMRTEMVLQCGNVD